MDAAAGTGSPSSSPSSRPLHVVLCPWLAFGHMLPYLELAERLASRGHRVSYVSTPRNLVRLPPRRHAESIDLPRVEGLPAGAESTNDVPGDQLQPLWEAFDGLAAPFAEFLRAACADAAGGRPDWVLANTFHYWAPAAAGDHGVPCAMLMPTAAFIAALACGAQEHAELAAASIFEHPIAVCGGGGEPPAGMPRYEWEGNAPLFAAMGGVSGMSVARRTSLTLERCTIAALRSCPEWELGAFPLAAAVAELPFAAGVRRPR